MTHPVERIFTNLPDRIAGLPRDARGFPVPKFVEWLDEKGRPVPPGHGAPDFRISSRQHMLECVKYNRCWICGGLMGVHKVFVIGPMCSVNRISSEPPSHKECALFAAQNCPFLSRPLAKRRTDGMPAEFVEPAGFGLARNPQVCLVWTTKTYRMIQAHRGQPGSLFEIGEAESVLWFCEGRPATRAECEHSIETGYPVLLDMARKEGQRAVAELVLMADRSRRLLPAA